MEDLTVQLGLLLETAQSQQQLTAAALTRLGEHTRGLDDVVRETISAALVDELQALGPEVRQAALALRSLQRAASMRALLWSAGVALPAAAVPLALGAWLLPTPAQIATLKNTQAELTADIARLSAQGGRVQLRRCGAAHRLCVRVERTGPAYGEGADFLIVKGY